MAPASGGLGKCGGLTHGQGKRLLTWALGEGFVMSPPNEAVPRIQD